MATTTPTPHAEATVQVRTLSNLTWRTSMDMDPIQIPVELCGASGVPVYTDVFNDVVYGIVTAFCELEAGDTEFEYRLVWSATGHDVKGTCPVCDDTFPVAEGFPGDELNEGYDAVCCGCDPRH